MRRDGLAPIVIILLASALLIGAALYLFVKGKAGAPSPRACTTEARQCPDGNYVGRSGPNCEFAACPGPSPIPPPGPGPGPGSACGSDADCSAGYRCIQDCGPPVVRQDDPPPGSHCLTEEQARNRMCPICLASNMEISTPDGPVNVKDVTKGMRVWSMDARGERFAAAVIATSRTPASRTHQVSHLVLADGRQAWVSPEHPLADGRPVQALHVGETYDGARVVSADLMTYWDEATYDLLPDGPTGAYWANGVLLGSTLR